MFENQKFVTGGTNVEIPFDLQLTCWDLISDLGKKKELDYLQIFVLSDEDGRQVIEHRQEQPKYSKKYIFRDSEKPVTAKLFAIDDGDHSTLMLADEY
jgi:hypothetical protein